MLFSSWLRNWKASLERRAALKQILRRRPPTSRFARRLFLETLEDRTVLSNVTISGSQLLTADGAPEYVRVAETGATALGNNLAFNASPGVYHLDTFGFEGTYGSFTIANDGTISGTTGALAASGNTINFDLTKLAAVTVVTGDLKTADGRGQDVGVGNVVPGLGAGADTVYLPVGTFNLTTYGNVSGDYGSLTVSANNSGELTVSAVTGAAVATGNTIDFDLTKLDAVTVNGADLTSAGGRQQIAAVEFVVFPASGTDTYYLPAGTYTVTDYGLDVYGSFTVSANSSGALAVTATTGAAVATGNTIDFDLTKLAAVTVNAHDLKTAAGLQQQAGLTSVAWPAPVNDTYYLPAGTYTVTDYGLDVYGSFTVSANSSGALAVTATTGAAVATGNTIDFDRTKLAAVTVVGTDLATATGRQEGTLDMPSINGLIYRTDTYYLPAGTFSVTIWPTTLAYGSFTVSADSSGALAVTATSGAAIATTPNQVDFETCELNQVQITPNPGVSWNIPNVVGGSTSDVVPLPNGSYTLVLEDTSGNSTTQTFSISPSGLSATQLPQSNPLVTLRLVPCAPVLESATRTQTGVNISGGLMGAANTTYQVNFYGDSTATASGQGQGETLLGSTSVTTDSNGNATFTASVAAPPPGETLLSATATDPNGNISDFSQVICLPASATGTVYTVYTTADSGPGSLRQAILDSNTNATGTAANPDEIVFCIPTTDPGYNSTTGAFTIQPLSALPTITDTLILDGYTQPGASANTLTIGDNAVLKIVLDGSQAGAVEGLVIGGGNSTVRGLVIDNLASGSGIVLNGSGNDIIVGNFIGTDVTGEHAAANNIGINSNSAADRIGGTSPGDRNIISGNNSALPDSADGGSDSADYGISAGSGLLIQGNYIGTDKSGTTAVPNGANNAASGIYLASNNTVGGTAAGAGNVISGNTFAGIRVVGNQNLMAGNLIGTTATGLAALDNGNGIYITGNNNTIGGTTAGARNIISCNGGPGSPTSFGIGIDGQYGAGTGSYNLVEGNYIGTDITGTVVLAYQGEGIRMSGDYNTIGGTTATARNVICGNTAITLFTSNTSFTDGFGNAILGNYIGIDASGTRSLGTGYGVRVVQGANDNTIGGTTTGAGNTIAFCGAGVEVDSGSGDSILGNSISSNVSGIYLDSANNANNNQAAPVLTGVSTSSNSTTISGTMQSAASTTYRIEIFANASMDPSGDGQGQTYLGFTNVTTDASGNASFTATFNTVVPTGYFISATATDPGGDTSEFAKDRVVGSYLVTNTNDSGPGSLREAIYDANTLAYGTAANPDTIAFAIPTSDHGYNSTTGSFTIQPLSALPAITDTLVLDGYTQSGASPNTLGIGPLSTGHENGDGDNAVLRIELDGSLAGSGAVGLDLTGGSSTIEGLAINSFDVGIATSNNGGDVIQGNFIGTDISGTLAKGNVALGIEVESNNNIIGGTTPAARNIISGTQNSFSTFEYGNGILISDCQSNQVEGNLIGVDASGTRSLANVNGIAISDDATDNTIGGTTADARNIISGNETYGVIIQLGAAQNFVEGNFIGTDVTGTNALANLDDGVELRNGAGSGNVIGGLSYLSGGKLAGAGNVICGSTNGLYGAAGVGTGVGQPVDDVQIYGNFIGTDVTGTRAVGNYLGVWIQGSDNTIGGPNGLGNLISGNGTGILLDDGIGNTVQGNRIGTDVTGMIALVNFDGVYDGASGTMIGGTAPGTGNLISGNTNAAVYLDGSGALMQGNLIGVNKNGSGSLPGGRIEIDGVNNLLGGLAPGAGNTIAYSGGDGVLVNSGSGNSILSNSIYSNTAQGIFLNTANNANNNQAAPVLTSGSASASGTSISGTLASMANTTFRIEFFSNAGLDASGNAEGQTYLGFTTVTTDSTGHAAFTATNLAAIPTGQGYVTATATKQSTGDTSEFSNYLTAPTSTVLTSSTNPSLLNQSVTFTATVSSSFGTPTGSVDFVDTTTNTDLGTVALSSSGTASVTVSSFALGTHVIEATYAGQGLFLASSGTLSQQVSYGFSFLPPLSNGLVFAVNRTIPIKFTLSDYNGTAITRLTAVTSLQIQALDANGNPVGAPFNPASTNNQGLQYNGDHYQFNWQTKGLAAGSYEILLTLADGTTHIKTIALTAGGSSAGLVTDGSGGTATAGALLGGEVDLYVDNSNGDLTSDELARIADAVNSIDATIAPYGVVVNEVSDPSSANVTLSMNTTSSLGGMSQGVLGCTSDADQVTMIQGWNWYAGSDPTQVGSGQYDFETAVVHELGHVLGLGHSSSSSSVMYASLATGTANRTLVSADLNVPDSDSGPCALHAAPAVSGSATSIVPSSASPSSGVDQLFSELSGLWSNAWNAYESEWSSLWQAADALALRRLDALVSLQAGGMGMSKDTLMRDLLAASRYTSNGV